MLKNSFLFLSLTYLFSLSNYQPMVPDLFDKWISIDWEGDKI